MLNNWENITIATDKYGRQVEERKITDNLSISFYNNGNYKTHVKVDYLNGKFKIEKMFNDTLEGNILKENFIDLIDSEDKVRKYLGI